MGYDLRQALRLLTRNPGFSAVTIVTLALGLGATTAVVAVVHTVLLKPLPYPEGERIVQVWERGSTGALAWPSDPNFEDLQRNTPSFDALAQYRGSRTPVSVGEEVTQTVTAAVSAQFFAVMRVQPWMGRLFLPDEQRPGAPRVALLSHRFWRRHFGDRRDLAGASIRVGRDSYAVVAVMPPGFEFPFNADVWTPREQLDLRSGRSGRNSWAIARLRPGVTIAQARAQVSAIAKRLKQDHGEDTAMADADVIPLHEQLVGRARGILTVLLVSVGLLLIVACANVLNLLLARLAGREGEVAVRVALGAGRWRMGRQFVAETGLLSFIGGVLGVLIAVWSVGLVRALQPPNLPRINELTVGWPVVAFALVVTVVISLVLGFVAAWRAGTWNLRQSLYGSGRAAASRSGRRTRYALLVVQVAFALVLLVGAGLLVRSLVKLLDVKSGFRMTDVTLLHLYLPSIPRPGSPEASPVKARRVEVLDKLVDRISSLPGVLRVGLISAFPLTGGGMHGTFILAKGPSQIWSMDDFNRMLKERSLTGNAQYRAASEGYFSTMAIPLVRGRLFNEGDTIEAPHVALISESLARARWPDTDPLGHQLQFGNMDGDLRLLRIIGVVGDVRESGLDVPSPPIIYTYYRQRPQTSFTLVAHVPDSPATVSAAIRSVARQEAPDVPTRLTSVDDVIGVWLGWRRTALLLVGLFGGTALLLAVTGLYGAMSYAVMQQTRDLGVRAALGADRRALLGGVLQQCLVIVSLGCALGTATALAVTGSLRSLLFGVAPTDPVTFAASIALLTAVALAACYVPALRAAEVDPIAALRAE